MRIELIYTPGCQFSRDTLNALESVIAEERLPIPVEVTEKSNCNKEATALHTILIDGDEWCDLPVKPQGEFCRLYNSHVGLSGVPAVDHLREVLFGKWKELTQAPLMHFDPL